MGALAEQAAKLGIPPELVTLGLNFLNYVIFAGALLVKLPQIIGILRTWTVEGLSEVAMVMEFLACLSYCSYSMLMEFPFKTWGEMALIAVQVGFQIVLYWGLTTQKLSIAPRLLCTLLVGASLVAVAMGMLPAELLPVLGMVPTVMGCVARIPQIILNFRQGHCGNQSVITWGMSFVGNLVRIITVSAVVGDMIMLSGHLASGFLNMTLVLQILFYWEKSKEVVAAGASKKAKKAD